MRDETLTRRAAHAPHDAASAAAPATVPDGRVPLTLLFRHALAGGPVHPLLHVLQQHRGGAALVPSPAPLDGHAPPCRLPLAAIDAQQLRRRIVELPSLPQAVLDVMAVLRDEDASIADVAQRIERDQALTARTLRIANSAFYGVPGRIGTIGSAIGILGLRSVATLLSTAAVSSRFANGYCPGFCFDAFWRHAVTTALAARTLARQLRIDGDDAFTAGLLHDIGRLALATQFPLETSQALRHALDADLPLLAAERAVLDTDHLEVGVLIATHWRFPPPIIAAIALHHAPPPGTAPTIVDVVHLADALAHGLAPAGTAHALMPPLDPAAWQRLDRSVAQCLATLDATATGVEGLCEALAL